MKKKNILESRKEFFDIYYQKISPILMRLESERKTKLLNFWLTTGIIAIISATLVFTIKTPDVIAIFTFVPLVMVAIIGATANEKFCKRIKTTCMYQLLSAFGDIRWDSTPKDIIPSDLLENSNLFSSFNIRKTDDEFFGTYNDVEFKISETTLARESGSGKNRRRYQVFQGVIVTFKSNKTINNKTVITTKGDGTLALASPIMKMVVYGIGAVIFGSMISFKAIIFGVIIAVLIALLDKRDPKMETIELEDPNFCKKFNVFSSDQVEARYLITPTFMERFLNLKTSFGARDAKCAFFGDDIMLAITSYKNLFEIGNLFHKLDNPDTAADFFNEISSILSLIDYFKLDEKTGL